ncbi:unnamed protein product [Rhizophagus irregularis]|nr:unnamed protein product [Rhizophagus irregularis]
MEQGKLTNEIKVLIKKEVEIRVQEIKNNILGRCSICIKGGRFVEIKNNSRLCKDCQETGIESLKNISNEEKELVFEEKVGECKIVKKLKMEKERMDFFIVMMFRKD